MMVIDHDKTCPHADTLDPSHICHGFRASKWFLDHTQGNFFARCTGGHVVEFGKWIPDPSLPTAEDMAATCAAYDAAHRTPNTFDANAPF